MPKVWLITGCSRGFGWALAERVLAAGEKLVATARDPSRLADLAKRYGDQVRVVALDVTDPAAAAAAVKLAVEAFGRLDVVVNNAGYGDISSIEDTSLAEVRAQIETNLFGVIIVTKAAIPRMREQKAGHIIQFSSIAARHGAPGLAAYTAAKWGVEGFSESLAAEVAPFGVKVTIIEPGGFRTDWAGSSMTVRSSRPEYEASVGAISGYLRSSTHHGAEPGDPAKAAAVIMHIVDVDEPPLRLLLGADALHIAEQCDAARIESDRKWRDISLSTGFESAGGAKVYPWE